MEPRESFCQNRTARRLPSIGIAWSLTIPPTTVKEFQSNDNPYFLGRQHCQPISNHSFQASLNKRVRWRPPSWPSLQPCVLGNGHSNALGASKPSIRNAPSRAFQFLFNHFLSNIALSLKLPLPDISKIDLRNQSVAITSYFTGLQICTIHDEVLCITAMFLKKFHFITVSMLCHIQMLCIKSPYPTPSQISRLLNALSTQRTTRQEEYNNSTNKRSCSSQIQRSV